MDTKVTTSKTTLVEILRHLEDEWRKDNWPVDGDGGPRSYYAVAADRIAELEAALRRYPREPVGLLANDAGFRDRVIAWHQRFAEWQFDLPVLSKLG